MKPPLISVITPTFNAEAVIERNLQTVISQDYENIEHLFVDNCSSDSTVALIRNYQQKHPHIRLLSGKDQGIYDAINKGMDEKMDDAIVVEEKLFGSCFQTEDQVEGMKAFLEKRKVEGFKNK